MLKNCENWFKMHKRISTFFISESMMSQHTQFWCTELTRYKRGSWTHKNSHKCCFSQMLNCQYIFYDFKFLTEALAKIALSWTGARRLLLRLQASSSAFRLGCSWHQILLQPCCTVDNRQEFLHDLSPTGTFTSQFDSHFTVHSGGILLSTRARVLFWLVLIIIVKQITNSASRLNDYVIVSSRLHYTGFVRSSIYLTFQ